LNPVGGGAGNALSHLAKEWAQLGHTVTIVTSSWPSLPREEVNEGVRIIRLDCGRRRLDRSRFIEWARFMFLSSARAREWLSPRPDLCLAFMAVPGGAAPYWIRKRFQIPYIAELRGGDVPGFGGKDLWMIHAFGRFLFRPILSRASAAIALTSELEELARKEAPKLPIELIPNGVDSEIFLPGPKKASEFLEIVFAGRFAQWQKDITTMLDAMTRVSQARLTICGDGPDRGLIENQVREKGLEGRVRIKGWCSTEGLMEIYRSADAYVSAACFEGIPNTALEAMASGLPLVLSDIPGHRILADQSNALVFPVKDALALARHLERLINEPALREKMGEASRRRAVESFSWSGVAQRQMEYFRQVLAREQKS